MYLQMDSFRELLESQDSPLISLHSLQPCLPIVTKHVEIWLSPEHPNRDKLVPGPDRIRLLKVDST